MADQDQNQGDRRQEENMETNFPLNLTTNSVDPLAQPVNQEKIQSQQVLESANSVDPLAQSVNQEQIQSQQVLESANSVNPSAQLVNQEQIRSQQALASQQQQQEYLRYQQQQQQFSMMHPQNQFGQSLIPAMPLGFPCFPINDASIPRHVTVDAASLAFAQFPLQANVFAPQSVCHVPPQHFLQGQFVNNASTLRFPVQQQQRNIIRENPLTTTAHTSVAQTQQQKSSTSNVQQSVLNQGNVNKRYEVPQNNEQPLAGPHNQIQEGSVSLFEQLKSMVQRKPEPKVNQQNRRYGNFSRNCRNNCPDCQEYCQHHCVRCQVIDNYL